MWRAAILYVGAVWALAQGIAQLSGPLELANWVTVWFLIACAIGFPLWIAFAWFYELTPQGFKRESEVVHDVPLHHSNARKLDFAIIGVLALAVILLGSGYFVQRGARARPPTLAASAIPQKSVAVLPFSSSGGASNQRFFSDGLSEDLITALSQFAGLKVISRDSAFQFRNSKDSSSEIGRLLGVAHLLEGTVQHEGSEVRVTATLVNATNGSIVWAQQYDKPYTDLFALQDAITRSVANALKARLLATPGAVAQSNRPQDGNVAAWMAFQQGEDYFDVGSESGTSEAVEAYRKAVKLDPRYAAAYAGLSNALLRQATVFGDGSQTSAAMLEARAAAKKAINLDPTSAAAYVAYANWLVGAMDWQAAQVQARRAVQLAPHSTAAATALGYVLAALGQNRAAASLQERALVNDPRSADGFGDLSVYFASLDETASARQAIGTAIALQPTAADQYEQLATIEILAGHPAAALAAARKETNPVWREIALALVMQIGTNRAAADAALSKLIADHANDAAYQIAEVYALRRDPNDAFRWLDRARSNRDPGIVQLLGDPFILRYQHDPRFAKFCQTVGLPITTDAVAMK